MGAFLRIDPDDQKPEKCPTRVWLWYDENNLYVHFEAVIDSTFTVGHYASKDIGSKGDYLFFNVLPNPDANSCYFYNATPSGALADGAEDLKGGSSYQWNSTYSYTTSYNDSLWTVDMQIPFKEMRFNPAPPYKWRVKVTRYSEFNKDYYACPYYSEKDPKDFYLKATDILMNRQIKRQSNWKLRPYFVKSYDLVNKTGTFDPDNVGLDISFNPSTKTKIKATFNPDFTDVPPDDAEDIYNNKYPTYYFENRFFFIEDIDAFGVGSDYFYSRNIMQPQFAAKFTGTQGEWNYGYLCAKDKKVTDNGTTINADDFYQLGAIGKRTDKYLLHTAFASRVNEDYDNHILMFDWEYEFIPKYRIGTYHTYTTKEQAQIDRQQGLYQYLYLDFNPGNWTIFSSYTNTQKDVAMDMGYFYDTGLESYSISSTWKADTRERYFKKITLMSDIQYCNKLEPGRPLDYVSGSSTFMVGFLPKYTAYITLSRGRTTYKNKEHETCGATFVASYNKWQAFSPSLAAYAGKGTVYSLNETKNRYYVRGYFSGSLKRSLNWTFVIYHYGYDYAQTNYIYTPDDTLTIRLDNSYQIANASLDFNASNRISLNNGMSLSTYNTSSNYSRVSFYSNLKYEFKNECFLYLGYKTGQTQDEPSNSDDLLGHFQRNTASAYLKISAAF